MIGKNGHVFEQSISKCGHHGHGVPEHPNFAAVSSAAKPNLSRPMPLARFGSGSSGQLLPSDAPFVLPVSIPPYTENKHGPAVAFQTPRNGHNPMTGSIPFLDPSFILSQGLHLNGKHQVYPSLRPTRVDGSTHVTGGYFVPSISESLKEAVKPNVPFMEPSSPQLGLSNESTVALMNVLDWVKSGASLQSLTRDAHQLKSQNGQT